MNNQYGLDASYFINLFARELRPDVVRNQTPDCLARVLARAARTACAEVLTEQEFQFNRLHRPGQIQEGDEIRFTLSGRVIDAVAVEVLHAGTPKEEVIYNRKKNHYFCTAMAVDGTSTHKQVLIRIKPGTGPDVVNNDIDAMLSALTEARQVLGSALKSSAPDWFKTDADVSEHHTIKQIDAAMAPFRPKQGDA